MPRRRGALRVALGRRDMCARHPGSVSAWACAGYPGLSPRLPAARESSFAPVRLTTQVNCPLTGTELGLLKDSYLSSDRAVAASRCSGVAETRSEERRVGKE